MSKNILIVDDQPKNLQIIADYLKESENSYEIMKAPNGKIALKLVEKKTPDLIITDWEMPVMDGIEFIKQLRKNIITVNIPVIMCTGVMLTSKNLQTALKAGASDFIRKPIDKIELTARTNSMLQLGASQQKLLEQNKTLSVLNA
ncbi:MAG: response regulator, partial [Bacteroidales bacterium]|nr:response regulator [Bacteroidales bacterium]